jgi:hypothetical protein
MQPLLGLLMMTFECRGGAQGAAAARQGGLVLQVAAIKGGGGWGGEEGVGGWRGLWGVNLPANTGWGRRVVAGAAAEMSDTRREHVGT